ncbi:MAG: hypothetical protein ACHRHE_12020 [Tepidisphaerales bacterium]
MIKKLNSGRPNKRTGVVHRRVVSRVEADSLEGRLVGLAMSGKLAKAGRDAVRAQVAKGLAVTFQRGTKVIKRHADGREEVLANVDRLVYSIPRGVAIIGRK